MKFVLALSAEDRRVLKDEIEELLYKNNGYDTYTMTDKFNYWAASDDLVELFEKKLLEAKS